MFAEPVAAAFQILAQVAIDPRDRVVVFGDGKLGQVIAQVLATTGCALTVVGRHPRKLAHLAARGIATQLEPPPPRRADVVVDCTGRREGLQAALAALRPRGTLVLKSTFAGETALNLSAIVVDEITIVGSRCGPFAPALAALASGAVDGRSADRARAVPLADAVERAWRAPRRPGTLKVLLSPMSRTVAVALPVPRLGLLTYAVPDGVALTPGVRVSVPLGKRTATGFVVALDPPLDARCRCRRR